MNIVDRARQLRKVIEMLTAQLEDLEAMECAELFPHWKEDTEYTMGDRVCYENLLYKCLQNHTSQSQWNPKDAVSLWAKVSGEDIPEWEQPSSTNPYMMGDKVRHNGYIWISTLDYNIWEPGIAGWDRIGE